MLNDDKYSVEDQNIWKTIDYKIHIRYLFSFTLQTKSHFYKKYTYVFYELLFRINLNKRFCVHPGFPSHPQIHKSDREP